MSENSVADFLKRHAPFDLLTPDALQTLASNVSRLRFADGQRLAAPDMGPPRHLYVIRSGLVRVTETDALTATASTLDEGQCFPIAALSGDRPSINTYDAQGEVECYAVRAEDFRRLIDSNPAIARYCSQHVSRLIGEVQRQWRAWSTEHAAEQRVLATELGQLVERAPMAVTGDVTLRDVLRSMSDQRIGSIVVVDDARIPIGIVTQGDVLRRVALPQLPLEEPVARVMSTAPDTLPEHAPALDAILLMVERGIRHVIVVDEAGHLTGVVSERDLFALQRIGIGYIRRAIDEATEAAGVAKAIPEIHRFALNMLAQGIGAEQLTRFISALNDAATRRIIELNLRRHDLSGIDWAWLAFGSEGREEQTLCTDQDNGIVFECGPALAIDEAKARLTAFGRAINADLDRCGYRLCEGGIMAGNPQWCLTLQEWKARFTGWIMKPEPTALLNATIFFDFRTILGKASLAQELRRHLFAMSRDNAAFQRMLAANALQVEPPLGTFRDFVTASDGSAEPYVDLKKRGARLFVDAARVYALALGIETANTVQRLRRAAAASGQGPDINDALIEAFNFIQLLRLRHQYHEVSQGRAADNRVVPSRLNEVERKMLKESLHQAQRVQQRLHLSYQLGVF